MELNEFESLSQKKKLALIAEMRRKVEAAICDYYHMESFRKPQIADYAELHRVMRSEILSPTAAEPFDLSPLAKAYLNLRHSYRVWMKLSDNVLVDQAAEEDRQRIDSAVEEKVTEIKEKRGGYREGAGRPSLGSRRTFGIVMPDEDWQKFDYLIKRSNVKPAEFLRDRLQELVYSSEPKTRELDEYGY